MRVVVSNPGSNQEMVHAAAGLARDGALARYHVPVAIDSRSLEKLPSPARARFAHEARRRPIPSGVPTSAVMATAPGSDAARVAASRLGLPARLQTRLAERHRRRFDRAVAARLTGAEDTVIAVGGSALATIGRARPLGVEALLDATLPHPRFLARLIAETGFGEPLPPGFAERRVGELELADRVLVPSSFARDSHIAEGVDPQRLVLAPLGVEADLFSPQREHTEDGRFRVLFVGRITRFKGVEHLVRAFGQAAIHNSELLLVGDRSAAERSWLSAPGVRHRPPTARQLLPPIFRRADVFVMPSLAESCGLAILEAMACGIPVVVSRNSVGPDVVDEGRSGYLVPVGDHDAIAERLVTLSRDADLRRRMGGAGARAVTRRTWPAYQRALIAALSAP